MQVPPTNDLRDYRFAVSGASGFIGRHLVSLLHERGAQVIMLRRPGSPTAPFTPIRSHVIDFTDTKACSASLRRLKPTHIVHLAGFANSDRSVDSISRSLDVNLTASMKLILGAMDAVSDIWVVVSGTLEQILVGPANENDGKQNLFGALQVSMATTGFSDVKEFQKAEVMIAPSLQTEGKSLQRSQRVRMG